MNIRIMTRIQFKFHLLNLEEYFHKLKLDTNILLAYLKYIPRVLSFNVQFFPETLFFSALFSITIINRMISLSP